MVEIEFLKLLQRGKIAQTATAENAETCGFALEEIVDAQWSCKLIYPHKTS